ncbi:hypothetical protein J2T13_000948 [Paenibacillus sp. DS2015]
MMKETGIVRKVDELGRIVIPANKHTSTGRVSTLAEKNKNVKTLLTYRCQ